MGLNTTLDLIERLLQDALQSLPPYITASIRTQLETTPAHLRADIELMNAVLNVYLFFVIIMVVSAVNLYILEKKFICRKNCRKN